MKTTDDYIADFLLAGTCVFAMRVRLYRDGVPEREWGDIINQVVRARAFGDQQMARVQ